MKWKDFIDCYKLQFKEYIKEKKARKELYNWMDLKKDLVLLFKKDHLGFFGQREKMEQLLDITNPIYFNDSLITIENFNELKDPIERYPLSGIKDFRPRWLAYYLKQHHRTLLDISCGNARNMLYWNWKGLSCVGTEYTDELVENCRSKKFSCDKVDLNKENLPFRDNQFDVSTMIAVVEHLEDPHKAVAEAIRVTKDLVMITTPKGTSYPHPEHLHYWYTSEELADELLPKRGYNYHIITEISKPLDFILRQWYFMLIIELDK